MSDEKIRERTRRQLAVMKAYMAGYRIEVKDVTLEDDAWEEVKAPKWTWGWFDYRVKPEPVAAPEKDFALERLYVRINELEDMVRKV